MAIAYLDFQAIVGITKHTGGLTATRDLLALCHADQAREALEVGCGIGVGVANLARSGCHVVGVDQSEPMLDWARRRAREHGVSERVDLVVASATDLPFDDGRFDVAYAESVLAFVDDPARAIREMVRVTRPGGYVGLNESIWTAELTPEIEAQMHDLGVEVRPADAWRSLCEEAGLEELVVRRRRTDPAAEVRNRLRWVGLSWAVRAWGRTLRLVVTEPESRTALKAFYGPGLSTLDGLGYALFAGRVPDRR